MFCYECGKEVEDEAKYCVHCGVSLEYIEEDEPKNPTLEFKEKDFSGFTKTQTKPPLRGPASSSQPQIKQPLRFIQTPLAVNTQLWSSGTKNNSSNATSAGNNKSKLVLSIVITCVVIFIIALIFMIVFFTTNWSKKNRINDLRSETSALLASGDYAQVYQKWKDIDLTYVRENFDENEYNQIVNIIGESQVKAQKEKYSKMNIGDTIKFGTYAQSSSDDSKVDEIEWIVVYKEHDQAMLVSKKVLDVQAFDSTNSKSYWEVSSLRKWLNNDFYNKAFSDYNKYSIVKYDTFPDSYSSSFSSSSSTSHISENPTKDNVFILSNKELTNYMNNDNLKKTNFSEYAKAQGVNHDKYWIRGTSWDQTKADTVNSNTTAITSTDVPSTLNGVRPAISVTCKIDDSSQLKVKTSNGDTIDIPKQSQLKDFIHKLQLYSGTNDNQNPGLHTYDCDSPTKINVTTHIAGQYTTNILGNILEPTLKCIDPNSYPVKSQEKVNNNTFSIPPEMDPLNKYNKSLSLQCVTKWDEASVDWILKNIFNCSDSSLQEFKSLEYLSNNAVVPGYYTNGYYYEATEGGYGGFVDFNVQFSEITFDGQYYYIKYNYKPDAKTESFYHMSTGGFIYAKMEIKDVDGSQYWSLHKLSDQLIH